MANENVRPEITAGKCREMWGQVIEDGVNYEVVVDEVLRQIEIQARLYSDSCLFSSGWIYSTFCKQSVIDCLETRGFRCETNLDETVKVSWDNYDD